MDAQIPSGRSQAFHSLKFVSFGLRKWTPVKMSIVMMTTICKPETSILRTTSLSG